MSTDIFCVPQRFKKKNLLLCETIIEADFLLHSLYSHCTDTEIYEQLILQFGQTPFMWPPVILSQDVNGF